MRELLPVLVDALFPVAVSAALGLFAWLSAAIRSRLKAGAARDAALELVSAAEVVVRDLEQRIKPELAKRSADGRLSVGELADLKELAMGQLRDQLSDHAQKVLKSNGTRVEAALSRAIEAAVNKLKETRKEPAP